MRIEAIPFLAVVFDWCCCFWLVLLFLAGIAKILAVQE
jgi:hypothetical protein